MGAVRALWRYLFCLFVFGLFFADTPLWAAGAMESIHATTDEILRILGDPDLKGPERKTERRARIRLAVDRRFDWEAMARGSLGAAWRDLKAAQKDEFADLFSTLVERAYMDRLEDYSGEDVVYLEEETDGPRARVRVKIITRRGQEIPVEYRLKEEAGEWRVYDILIEGISLVRNYRVQFDDILIKSSYGELLKRLKEKVSEES